MTTHERIEVTIKEDGTVEVDAIGFQGQDCQAATRAIELAIGQATSSTKKPEFHQGQSIGAMRKVGH